MTISEPQAAHLKQLRNLWKAAFGDGDDFLDMFYTTAYAPHRCRCILDGDRVAAVLYWFDCSCEGRKLAYIYAVATDPAYRNRGLCRLLMDDTALHLKICGYACALLRPQEEGLWKMYGKMGYIPATCIREFTCQAAGEPIMLTELSAEAYARLRKTMLPPGGVLQEGENLSYLAGYAKFYQGPGFLLTAFPDGNRLIGCEILGDVTKAPAVLLTLGLESGTFRCPGSENNFTMYLPLMENPPKPEYFAFVFD